eukprot:TRINITY_DN1781_c0_g1_i1.p1 TRINITY_DN1781_c0_g1~~TRINITY_DN1781_c0_g1_i1.p1  ORF type:complete len:902 (-),score=295.52 TRINITY_DN1781_c0_g1_i1:564-2894(-)
MLWSFLKTHLNNKVLVFCSSCRQTKFIYEAFKRLRPGVPLKCLHGKMKQMLRLAVFNSFCHDEKAAVLFATDVASRGLDFPTVDWVVQLDCPEDVATYIHRVGRTARFTATGRSLLFLLPSERAMLAAMEAAKIPFKLTKANPAKIQQMAPALAGLLSRDPELKYLAQRAFVTYLRSIHLQANKTIFDVASLPHEEYAASLGLPNAPKIRFLKKGGKRLAEDAAARALQEGKGGGEEEEEKEAERGPKARTKEVHRGDDGESNVGREEHEGEENNKKKPEMEEEEEEDEEENEEEMLTSGDERLEDEEKENGGNLTKKRRLKGEAGWRSAFGIDDAVAALESTEAEEQGKEISLARDSNGKATNRPRTGKDEEAPLMKSENKKKQGRQEVDPSVVPGASISSPSSKGAADAISYEEVDRGSAPQLRKGPQDAALEEKGPKKKKTKIERMFTRTNRDVFSAAYESLREQQEEQEGPGGVPREGKGRKGTGAGQKDDSGDEGELMHVKRKDHLLDGEEPGEGSTRALDLSFLSFAAQKAKKKKLRIDPGRMGNNRLIFDDEGQALPPLAALGRDFQEDRAHASNGGQGASPEADDGTDEVANLAAERFRRVQIEMQQRDAFDRLREKERLRERRMKMKKKSKERSGDAEREEMMMSGMAMMGSGDGEDEDEEGGSAREEFDLEERDEAEGEEEKRRGGKRRSRSEEGFITSRYDEEESFFGGVTKKDRGVKKRRGGDDKELEREGGVDAGTSHAVGVSALSIGEQEALALKLLGARRR